jgi:RimJ/RimL family protein N-acetyltransferase
MTNSDIVDFDSPILSIDCQERDGVVRRSVYPLKLTIPNLYNFWLKAKQFPTLFSQDLHEDFGEFTALFINKDTAGYYTSNGIFWVIDNFVGVFYITDIYGTRDASVHYTFFDRRQHGRLLLAKSMIKYAFDTFKFQRLSTTVPLYASKPTFAFVRRCGFREEGRKRSSSFYKGEWFDTMLYGILKKNVTEGYYLESTVENGS